MSELVKRSRFGIGAIRIRADFRFTAVFRAGGREHGLPFAHFMRRHRDLRYLGGRLATAAMLRFHPDTVTGCLRIDREFLREFVTELFRDSAFLMVTALAYAHPSFCADLGAGGRKRGLPFAHFMTCLGNDGAFEKRSAHRAFRVLGAVMRAIRIYVNDPIARDMRDHVNIVVNIYVVAIAAGMYRIARRKAGRRNGLVGIIVIRGAQRHILLLRSFGASRVGIANVAFGTVPIFEVAVMLTARRLIRIVEHRMLVVGNGVRPRNVDRSVRSRHGKPYAFADQVAVDLVFGLIRSADRGTVNVPYVRGTVTECGEEFRRGRELASDRGRARQSKVICALIVDRVIGHVSVKRGNGLHDLSAVGQGPTDDLFAEVDLFRGNGNGSLRHILHDPNAVFDRDHPSHGIFGSDFFINGAVNDVFGHGEELRIGRAVRVGAVPAEEDIAFPFGIGCGGRKLPLLVGNERLRRVIRVAVLPDDGESDVTEVRQSHVLDPHGLLARDLSFAEDDGIFVLAVSQRVHERRGDFHDTHVRSDSLDPITFGIDRHAVDLQGKCGIHAADHGDLRAVGDGFARIELVASDRYLKAERFRRLFGADRSLSDLGKVIRLQIILFHCRGLCDIRAVRGNVEGDDSAFIFKNAAVKHDLEIADLARSDLADILRVYRTLGNRLRDKSFACVQREILCHIEGEHVERALRNGVSALILNADQNGIAFTDHDLLGERGEIDVCKRDLRLRLTAFGILFVVRGDRGQHADRVFRIGGDDGRAAGDHLYGVSRKSVNGKFTGASAQIDNRVNELTRFVIDLVRIIEEELRGIVFIGQNAYGRAAPVANLRLNEDFAVHPNGIVGGDVIVRRFGIEDRYGLAPFPAVKEDTHQNGTAALVFAGLVCGIEDRVDLALCVRQRQISVLQHRGLFRQGGIAADGNEALAFGIRAVIRHNAVAVFQGAYALHGIEGLTRRNAHRIERAVAAVRKIAVAVKDIIEHVSVKSKVHNGGKTFRQNLLCPRAVLETGDMDAVCDGVVNVRGLRALVEIVFGRYAENIVICVFRPDDGIGVPSADLREVFIIGAFRSVDHGNGRESDEGAFLGNSSELNEVQGKSLRRLVGIVDVIRRQPLGLLRVSDIDLRAVGGDRVGSIVISVIVKDDRCAPLLAVPYGANELVAVIRVVLLSVNDGEIEFAELISELHDPYGSVRIGEIAVRACKEYRCQLRLRRLHRRRTAAYEHFTAAPDREFLLEPKRLHVRAEIAVDLKGFDSRFGQDIKNEFHTDTAVNTDGGKRAADTERSFEVCRERQLQLVHGHQRSARLIVEFQRELERAVEFYVNLQNDGDHPNDHLRLMLEGISDVAPDGAGGKLHFLIAAVIEDELTLKPEVQHMLIDLCGFRAGAVGLVGRNVIFDLRCEERRYSADQVSALLLYVLVDRGFDVIIDHKRARQISCAPLICHLELRKVERAVIRVLDQNGITGRFEVNAQSVINVITDVGGSEANIVYQPAALVAEAVRALAEGARIFTVSRLGVRFGLEIVVARQREDCLILRQSDAGSERFAEIEIKGRRAEELLDRIGKHAAEIESKAALLVKAEVDILGLEIKVDHVDIQHLAAFHVGACGGLYRQSRFDRLVRLEMLRGNGERTGITRDLRLCGELFAVLDQMESGVRAASVPEAEHGDHDIRIFRLQNGIERAVLVFLRGFHFISVKSEVEISRLAVDITLAAADAENVGLLRQREVGDEHFGIEVEVVIVSKVALLLHVNMDIRADVLTVFQRGEHDLTVPVGIEVELIGDPTAVTVERIGRDDRVSVRDGRAVGCLECDEVIVGFDGAVGNGAHGIKGSDLLFAPSERRGGFSVRRPAVRAVLRFEAGRQRVARIIVNLFSRRGNGFGVIVNVRQIGAITEGARADGDCARILHDDLLYARIAVEGGIVDRGYRGGNLIVHALDRRGIAVKRRQDLRSVIARRVAVKNAVAVIAEIRVLLRNLDVFQRKASDEEIVAVKTCRARGDVSASAVSLSELNEIQLSAIRKGGASDQFRFVVEVDFFKVFRAAERLRGDRLRDIFVREGTHIVFRRAVFGGGILQEREACHAAVHIRHGAEQNAVDRAVRSVQRSTDLRLSVVIIDDREGLDLRATAERGSADVGNAVVDLNISGKRGLIERSRSDACKRVVELEFLQQRIFKCRIADIVELILSDQIFKANAVCKRVRADDVDLAERDFGQILIALKGVAFDDGHAVFSALLHAVGQYDRRSFAVFGIFDQSCEYPLVVIAVNDGISVKNTCARAVILVLGIDSDGNECVRIAERAIPDRGSLRRLSFSDEAADMNGAQRFIAVEGVSVKADDLIEAVVVGDEFGNDHGITARHGGIDRVIECIGAFADDGGIFLRINGIINALTVGISVENGGTVHARTARGLDLVPARADVHDHVRACVERAVADGDGSAHEIDLCVTAPKGTCRNGGNTRVSLVLRVAVGVDDDGLQTRYVLEDVALDLCNGNLARAAKHLERNGHRFLDGRFSQKSDHVRAVIELIAVNVVQLISDAVTVRIRGVDRVHVGIGRDGVAVRLTVRREARADHEAAIRHAVMTPAVSHIIVGNVEIIQSPLADQILLVSLCQLIRAVLRQKLALISRKVKGAVLKGVFILQSELIVAEALIALRCLGSQNLNKFIEIASARLRRERLEGGIGILDEAFVRLECRRILHEIQGRDLGAISVKENTVKRFVIANGIFGDRLDVLAEAYAAKIGEGGEIIFSHALDAVADSDLNDAEIEGGDGVYAVIEFAVLGKIAGISLSVYEEHGLIILAVGGNAVGVQDIISLNTALTVLFDLVDVAEAVKGFRVRVKRDILAVRERRLDQLLLRSLVKQNDLARAIVERAARKRFDARRDLEGRGEAYADEGVFTDGGSARFAEITACAAEDHAIFRNLHEAVRDRTINAVTVLYGDRLHGGAGVKRIFSDRSDRAREVDSAQRFVFIKSIRTDGFKSFGESNSDKSGTAAECRFADRFQI